MLVEGVNSLEENAAFERGIRETLGQLGDFSPDDRSALYVSNTISNYLQTQGIFNGIQIFIWIIGIGTLIAGIVDLGKRADSGIRNPKSIRCYSSFDFETGRD